MFTTPTPLPRFEFAQRDEDMAEMQAERAHHEAQLDAQIEEGTALTASAPPALDALDQEILGLAREHMAEMVGKYRLARHEFETTGDLDRSDWAAKYLHAACLHAEKVRSLGGQVEAPELQPEPIMEAPIEQPATEAPVEPEAIEQPAARKRCPHYHQIREMFAVACEKGLDVSEAARDRMRGALGMLLGRRIESRADLSGAEWGFCTNAIRMGRLFW